MIKAYCHLLLYIYIFFCFKTGQISFIKGKESQNAMLLEYQPKNVQRFGIKHLISILIRVIN